MLPPFLYYTLSLSQRPSANFVACAPRLPGLLRQVCSILTPRSAPLVCLRSYFLCRFCLWPAPESFPFPEFLTSCHNALAPRHPIAGGRPPVEGQPVSRLQSLHPHALAVLLRCWWWLHRPPPLDWVSHFPPYSHIPPRPPLTNCQPPFAGQSVVRLHSPYPNPPLVLLYLLVKAPSAPFLSHPPSPRGPYIP